MLAEPTDQPCQRATTSGRAPHGTVLFAVARPEATARHVQSPIEALITAAVLEGRKISLTIHDDRLDDPLPGETFDLLLLLTQTYDRTQCYSLRLDNARDLANRMRARYPGTPLVACGVHADIEPALTARALGAVPCLPGEVEASVPWLCEQVVVGHADLSEVDLARAPRRAQPHLLPTPSFGHVDMTRYRGEIIDSSTFAIRFGQAGLLFANRGCPYTCTYCHVWFGNKLRMRPPGIVVSDIRALTHAGIDSFFFLDYTFTFDRAWVLELCRRIVDSEISASWLCQTRCERVDRELLRAMRRAGCTGVYYGVETPWIAEVNVRKRTHRNVIDRAIHDTAAEGMLPLVFVLLGLEGYDADRQRELVTWLGSLPATFSARPLLPRPHTELFDTQVDRPAGSWAELEAQAMRVGFEYWPPELEDLEAQLRRLPNNILNVPSEVDA